MKTWAILAALAFSCALPAQTVVNGQAVDPDGVAWANGTWSAQYTLPPDSWGTLRNGLTNAPIIPSTLTGSLDATGSFSINLVPSINVLLANNAGYSPGVIFTVCPQMKWASCYTTPVIAISSTSPQSVTSQIGTAISAGPRIVGAGPQTQAYADIEVQAASGSQYFRLQDSTFRCYTNTWGPCNFGIQAGSNFPKSCTAAGSTGIVSVMGTYGSLPAATYSCAIKVFPGSTIGGSGVVLAGPIDAPDMPWLGSGVVITGTAHIKTIWFGSTDWAASLTAADAACGLASGCDIDMADGWGATPPTSATVATVTNNDKLYLGALTFPCGNAGGCVSTTADHITVSGANSGNPAASGASFIPSARFLATVAMPSMWLWGSHTGNGSGILERFMLDGGKETVCTTAALANNSTTLTCGSAAWSAGDVGKPQQVTQGGTTYTPTITAFVSSTQVTINTTWTGTAFTAATVTEPYANVGVQLGTTSAPLFLGETLDHVAGRNLGTWAAVEASIGNPAQNLKIIDSNCGDNTAATNPVATCVDASIGPLFILKLDGGRMLAADIPLRLGPDSSTSNNNTGEAFDIDGAVDIETLGNAARRLVLFGNVTGATIHDCYMEFSATNTGAHDMVAWGGPGGGSAQNAIVQNCKIVNDGRTTYGFAWANGTTYPKILHNTLTITGDTDLVNDAATNSFGQINWNIGHATSNLIDSGAHLQQSCNSTGSAFHCGLGQYLDAGNSAQLQDFYTSADTFNAVSIRSGFNSQPYMLSFGVNQASGYGEIQAWRSEIGFSGVNLQLQRQGGNVLMPNWIPNLIYSAAGTALPTCATGNKGEMAVVSDATSPTYMGTYTSGGSVVASVICNGSTWLTH